MSATVTIPVTADFRTGTLSDINYLRGLLLLGNYLYGITQTSPGKLVRVNKSNFADYTAITFTADGNHINAVDLVYAGFTNRIYVLFGALNGIFISAVDPDTLTITNVVSDASLPAAGFGSITTDQTYLYVLTFPGAVSTLVRYALSNFDRTDTTLTGYQFGTVIRFHIGKLYATGLRTDAANSTWVLKLSTELTIEASATFPNTTFVAAGVCNMAVKGQHLWLAFQNSSGEVKRLNLSDLGGVQTIATGVLSPIACLTVDDHFVWSLFENGDAARIESDLSTSLYTLNPGEGYLSELIGDGQYLHASRFQTGTVISRYNLNAVDTTPPTSVRLLAPTHNNTVSGVVTFEGSASDNAGVSKIEFNMDHLGSWLLLGTAIDGPPWRLTFNTANVFNGAHYCFAKAFDDAGNFGTSALAQVTVQNDTPYQGQFRWFRDIGGIASAQATGNAVAFDPSNNSIVAGSFIGTVNFGGTNKTSTPSGGNDIFIAKYSAQSGALLWVNSYGSTAHDVANGVAVDSAGNIIVTGYFGGTVDFGDGNPLTSGSGPSGSDIFLAKYNSSGVCLWSKRFGSASGPNAGVAVAVDGSDNILLGGTCYGEVNFGLGAVAAIGSLDVFAAKFNASGTCLWAKIFGSTSADYLTGITVNSTGDVVITGNNNGSIDFGGGPKRVSATTDAFLAKLSGANGAHLWSYAFGGTGVTLGNDVAFDPSGNVMMAGTFTGTTDFGGGNLVAPSGSAFFVAKYNASGSHQWSHRHGGESGGNEQANGVATDTVGNIVVTGNALGRIDFGDGRDSYGSGYNANGFVAKYTPAGAYLWAQRFNDTYNSSNKSIAMNGAGDSTIAGFFGGTITFGGIAYPKQGFIDALLLKLSP